MAKRPLALLLGVTADLAFAAGALLLSLRRHSPNLRPDIRIYTDGGLAPGDERLLRELGAETAPYAPPAAAYRPESVAQFSLLALARFEALPLLRTYSSVIWLDVDTAIQGDITELANRGPLALAREDPAYNEDGRVTLASVNTAASVPELDAAQPNCNSGVLVFRDTIPDPEGVYSQCMRWLTTYAEELAFPDQTVVNMLVQRFLRESPELVDFLPIERFNCHPRNPKARHAAIVHMFGPFKTWYDGLTRCSFPEWDRDYAHWVALGGAPWRGPVTNPEYMEGGAFHMLVRLFELLSSAERSIDGMRRDLDRERALRAKLEKMVRMLGK